MKNKDVWRDKITPMKNKDVWSKGNGNQQIKYPQTTTTTTNNHKTKCKASPQT